MHANTKHSWCHVYAQFSLCVCMYVCLWHSISVWPTSGTKTQRKKTKQKKKITNKEIKNNELTLAWVIEKKKRQKLKKKGSSAHNLPSTSYTKKKRAHLPHGKNDREGGVGKKKYQKQRRWSVTYKRISQQGKTITVLFFFFFLLPTLELQRNSTSRIQQQ